MYKILKGQEEIEWIHPPILRSEIRLEGSIKGVCGNSLRIQRESFKSRNSNQLSHSMIVRHNFFLYRVAPIWNKLPKHIVFSPSLNSLESSLDRIYKRFGCFGLKWDCLFNEYKILNWNKIFKIFFYAVFCSFRRRLVNKCFHYQVKWRFKKNILYRVNKKNGKKKNLNFLFFSLKLIWKNAIID